MLDLILETVGDLFSSACDAIGELITEGIEVGTEATDGVVQMMSDSPLDSLEESVTRVASDMKVVAPDVYSSHGSYGEFLGNDPTTILDDKIGADPNIVEAINATYGDRAYDVVTAHEIGHAKIAAGGLNPNLSPYAEEALCDVHAGFYAGTKNLPTGAYHDIIGPSTADASHPCGIERVELFDKAHNLANNYLYKDFQPITADPLQAGKVSELYGEVLSRYN